MFATVTQDDSFGVKQVEWLPNFRLLILLVAQNGIATSVPLRTSLCDAHAQARTSGLSTINVAVDCSMRQNINSDSKNTSSCHEQFRLVDSTDHQPRPGVASAHTNTNDVNTRTCSRIHKRLQSGDELPGKRLKASVRLLVRYLLMRTAR